MAVTSDTMVMRAASTPRRMRWTRRVGLWVGWVLLLVLFWTQLNGANHLPELLAFGILMGLPAIWMLTNFISELNSALAERGRQLKDVAHTQQTGDLALRRAREEINARQAAEAHEQRLAREIQLSFLPSSFPFPEKLYCVAHYGACEGVGGDLYGAIELDEHRVLFYIADVSGHGVSAALVTAIFTMNVRQGSARLKLRREVQIDVLDYVNQLNAQLAALFHHGLFITAQFFLLDVRDGALEIINVGHLPPLLWRSATNSLEALELPSNLPFGFMPTFNFEAVHTQLNPKDFIVLHTDGITELMDKHNREFGMHNLSQVLRSNALAPLEKILSNLKLEMRTFAGERLPQDDQALLLIQYLG